MRVREKVALIVAYIVILGIACTICMPRSTKKSGLKHYYNNNLKKSKANATPTLLAKKLSARNSGLPKHNAIIGQQNRPINKLFNFPDIEYPQMSNTYQMPTNILTDEANKFKNSKINLKSSNNTNNDDLVKYLDNLRKNAKLKRKIGNANPLKDTNDGSFKDLDYFPDVKYPLSMSEIWKPNFWNYMPYRKEFADEFKDAIAKLMQKSNSLATDSKLKNRELVKQVLNPGDNCEPSIMPKIPPCYNSLTKTIVPTAKKGEDEVCPVNAPLADNIQPTTTQLIMESDSPPRTMPTKNITTIIPDNIVMINSTDVTTNTEIPASTFSPPLSSETFTTTPMPKTSTTVASTYTEASSMTTTTPYVTYASTSTTCPNTLYTYIQTSTEAYQAETETTTTPSQPLPMYNIGSISEQDSDTTSESIEDIRKLSSTTILTSNTEILPIDSTIYTSEPDFQTTTTTVSYIMTESTIVNPTTHNSTTVLTTNDNPSDEVLPDRDTGYIETSTTESTIPQTVVTSTKTQTELLSDGTTTTETCVSTDIFFTTSKEFECELTTPLPSLEDNNMPYSTSKIPVTNVVTSMLPFTESSIPEVFASGNVTNEESTITYATTTKRPIYVTTIYKTTQAIETTSNGPESFTYQEPITEVIQTELDDFTTSVTTIVPTTPPSTLNNADKCTDTLNMSSTYLVTESTYSSTEIFKNSVSENTAMPTVAQQTDDSQEIVTITSPKPPVSDEVISTFTNELDKSETWTPTYYNDNSNSVTDSNIPESTTGPPIIQLNTTSTTIIPNEIVMVNSTDFTTNTEIPTSTFSPPLTPETFIITSMPKTSTTVASTYTKESLLTTTTMPYFTYTSTSTTCPNTLFTYIQASTDAYQAESVTTTTPSQPLTTNNKDSTSEQNSGTTFEPIKEILPENDIGYIENSTSESTILSSTPQTVVTSTKSQSEILSDVTTTSEMYVSTDIFSTTYKEFEFEMTTPMPSLEDVTKQPYSVSEILVTDVVPSVMPVSESSIPQVFASGNVPNEESTVTYATTIKSPIDVTQAFETTSTSPERSTYQEPITEVIQTELDDFTTTVTTIAPFTPPYPFSTYLVTESTYSSTDIFENSVIGNTIMPTFPRQTDDNQETATFKSSKPPVSDEVISTFTDEFDTSETSTPTYYRENSNPVTDSNTPESTICPPILFNTTSSDPNSMDTKTERYSTMSTVPATDDLTSAYAEISIATTVSPFTSTIQQNGGNSFREDSIQTSFVSTTTLSNESTDSVTITSTTPRPVSINDSPSMVLDSTSTTTPDLITALPLNTFSYAAVDTEDTKSPPDISQTFPRTVSIATTFDEISDTTDTPYSSSYTNTIGPTSATIQTFDDSNSSMTSNNANSINSNSSNDHNTEDDGDKVTVDDDYPVLSNIIESLIDQYFLDLYYESLSEDVANAEKYKNEKENIERDEDVTSIQDTNTDEYADIISFLLSSDVATEQSDDSSSSPLTDDDKILSALAMFKNTLIRALQFINIFENS